VRPARSDSGQTVEAESPQKPWFTWPGNYGRGPFLESRIELGPPLAGLDSPIVEG